MRIALDATYSVDRYPSGVAVYSNHLLDALPETYPTDDWLHCYRPKQFLRSRRRAPAVRRLLLPPVSTFRADVFHALNQRVDRRPAKRVISTFHDLFVMTSEYSSPEFRARFTAQAKQAAQLSDLILAVSEFTAGQVRSLLNVEQSRIRVVPHGVDLPRQQASVSRESVILFVGALQARKNLLRLIDAFEELDTNDWRLILAGSPGGFQAEAILKRIALSRRRDQIVVAGYLTDAELHRWYARASIFAFPSLDEGFGMPVLEAMAHGVPVLTANRSALPEVAGDAALLVDATDLGSIYAGLARLVADTGLRNELTRKGLERAASCPWGRSLSAVYEAYKLSI